MTAWHPPFEMLCCVPIDFLGCLTHRGTCFMVMAAAVVVAAAFVGPITGSHSNPTYC